MLKCNKKCTILNNGDISHHESCPKYKGSMAYYSDNMNIFIEAYRDSRFKLGDIINIGLLHSKTGLPEDVCEVYLSHLPSFVSRAISLDCAKCGYIDDTIYETTVDIKSFTCKDCDSDVCKYVNVYRVIKELHTVSY